MITFHTVHWKWRFHSDNIVMERVTVLNWSVFAAIFFMSCFNEVGGFPHNLDRSKTYGEYTHSTGTMPPDGRENLVALSRAIREVDNNSRNLIDTSRETSPARGLDSPFEPLGSISKPARSYIKAVDNRIALPAIGNSNPGEIDQGSVGPP